MSKYKVYEGFEVGDLQLVLEPKLHIDEFRSKMGKDSEICVISFLINDRQAAIDLVDFFERGYDFILDCDISDSELRPGSYLVFVEFQRRRRLIQQLQKIISDLSASAQLNMKDWKFRYMGEEDYHSLTPENLLKYVPLFPRAYNERFNQPIEEVRTLAGLKNEKFIPQDPMIEQLMFNAGISYESDNGKFS